MRFPSFWFRAGGAAVAGAAVIACAASAAVGGTSPASRGTHRTAGSGGTASGGTGSGGTGSGSTGSGGTASGSTASGRASGGTASGGTASGRKASGESATGGASAAARQAARLTTRQKAGQRVIYSYSGLTPPPGLLWLIRHGEAAGVIFFGNNISSRAQITSAIRRLEAADAASTNPVRSPLLLMTDQEGGLVRRLSGAPALSEKQIGEAAHPAAAATAAGRGAARNLRGVGMNLNLAPVLDVYRSAGDFDDHYQRSYSRSAHKVSYLGADFIKAQQHGGVAATAKHFPGLGAASRNQDTDLARVTLHVSAAKLRSVDEYPYRAAIKAKVKLVMVSWAVYPALDRTRPAGLSSKIVQGELRQRLGFTGVTITDALEAGALRSYGSITRRALLAGQAGMDLLLCAGQSVAEGDHCMDGLESGYRSGQLNRAAFQAADTRILSLRAGLPQ